MPKLTEFKLCIAGGRHFQNFSEVETHARYWLRVLRQFGLELVINEGGALGADRCGRRFAEEYCLLYVTYKADWGRYKNAAGMVRNNIMLKDSHGLLAFWDGESKGTANSISLAKKLKLPYMVVKYGKGIETNIFDLEGNSVVFEDPEFIRGKLHTILKEFFDKMMDTETPFELKPTEVGRFV